MRSDTPLTLDQLRGMNGQPAWIVPLADKDWEPHWDVMRYGRFSANSKTKRGRMYFLYTSSYRVRWIAYARPPLHIDRENWTAEWIYPKSEFSLPKCSKCGCNSKDATYGHKDNFCPKCGRAMNDEAWAELQRRLEGVNNA